jgi:DNA repair protein RadC
MTGAAAPVVQFPVLAPPVAPVPLAHGEDPAARLQRYGADALSDTELIALLTRTRVRTEADLHAARALLRDGLAPLLRRVQAGTSDIPRRDATRLAAAFELARRAIAPLAEPRERFDHYVIGPRLASRYALDAQERLGVLLLDSRGRIISERAVFVGTLHSATVSTRDVLALALGLTRRGSSSSTTTHQAIRSHPATTSCTHPNSRVPRSSSTSTSSITSCSAGAGTTR